MKRLIASVLLLLLLATPRISIASGEVASLSDLPIKGKVNLVDVGSGSCIPCKLMAPIMKELEEEYRNKAAIVFVDLTKNPEQDAKFNIKIIPTQIFYDKEGKEVLRHEGFMDKKEIVAELKKLGVE